RSMDRFLAFALISLAACAAAPPPVSSPATAPPSWDAFVEQFIEVYLAAHPSFAVAMGRHEFDGQLPDWSAKGLAKDVATLERAHTTALGFEPAQLSQAQRFQRAYFLASVEGELFWLRDARTPFVNPAYYFGSGLDPNTYVSMPYAPADVRLRAFIRYARALPQALAQLRANLQQPLPLPYIEYGMRGF